MISFLKKSVVPAVLVLCIVSALITAAFFDPIRAASISIQSQQTQNKLTLIIDAGHGGTDGGAISASGEKESVFNLEISQKIKLLSEFLGEQSIMTRDSENIEYPESAGTIHEKKVFDTKRRVELCDKTQFPVLLSIHQNQYASSRVRGAQVLYAPTAGSEKWGADTQKIFGEKLNSGVGRTAEEVGDSIYLMNHIICPAILVECGFISSPEEEKMLKTGDYQRSIALAIMSAYLDNKQELENIYTGAENESKKDVLLHTVWK